MKVTHIFCVVIVLGSFGFLLLAHRHVKDHSPPLCEQKIINVTVTVTPKPFRSDNLLADWETSSWCLNNPDYSQTCFYEKICFNGRETIYFFDQELPYYETKEVKFESRESYKIKNVKDPNRYPYNIINTVKTETTEKHQLPLIDATTNVKVFTISPNSDITENIVIEEANAYFVYQNLPNQFPSNPYHFIKDNVMLWEVLRQNITFGSFFDFPSMDYAMILRPSLPESWEKDLLHVFINENSKIWFWEDFDALDISDDKLMCFNQFVEIITFLIGLN